MTGIDDAQARHGNYRADCDRLRAIWEKTIAGRGGPLPGAILDPIRTPTGWCGQVQLRPGQHSTRSVIDASSSIAAAFGLPRGSIVVEGGVDETADTAFIWAYDAPSQADYHEHRPMRIPDHSIGKTKDIHRSHVRGWASDYRGAWQALLANRGQGKIIDDVVHRLLRLRAGLIDLLPDSAPDAMRDLLVEQGVTAESLPRDLVELCGLSYDRDRR
ncbi:hypothetical protein [Microlunatus parietis]|uniref:Uncharacterized protein n=1 Tax=Microlunatus parietis TaxID=682979 RepID=A0A7Y9ICB7_9ACTN|nr:hypothetical protein [Microlunatus parietis]NYE74232.1 hypothetical protein [Microlunatus parietis]